MSHGLDDAFSVVVGRGEGVSQSLVARNFVTDSVASLLVVKFYALASATLLFYDFFITFPAEVRRIWSARFTGATVLFILNRYIPLFGYIVILISVFNPPWTISMFDLINPRCNMFAPFPGALNAFSQTIIVVILVLRTYALYQRQWWILVITASMGTANVAVSAWAASAVTGELFSFKPIVSCVPILQEDGAARLRYAWVATLLFDFLIFCLTIYRTYRLIKAQSKTNDSHSLARLVMRDGSLYFFVMSIGNAINFVFFIKITNGFFASTTGTNSMIAHVLSVCLMNRLLLNLRRESVRYKRENSQETESAALTDTNLIFSTRILGNLTNDLILYDSEESNQSYRRPSRRRRQSTAYTGYTAQSEYTYRTDAYSRADTNGGLSTGVYNAYSEAARSVASGSGTGAGTLGGASASSVASGSGLGQERKLAVYPPLSSPLGWYNEQSPTTAVDDVHPLRGFLNKSPISPDTLVEDDIDIADVEGKSYAGREDDWDSGEVGSLPVGSAIEMTRLDRRRNSMNISHVDESQRQQDSDDLYHDHYRQPYRPYRPDDG